MEANAQGKTHQFTPGGTTPPANSPRDTAAPRDTTAHHDAGGHEETITDRVTSAAQTIRDQGERAAEKLGQAKQKVGEFYEQANKSMSQQYGKAVDYSRDNPGKTTLVAFGVGIGVGMLLLGNLGQRNRRGRIVEPVLNAMSTLAHELFA